MSETVVNLWSIPLLVVIPILTAIVLNLLYNRVRAIRVASVVSAAALLVVSIVSPYGLQWFTGQPGVASDGSYTYSTSIFSWKLSLEYYFGPLQQILIFTSSLLLLFVVVISTRSLKKDFGPYVAIMFLTYFSTVAVIMVNDFYHLWIVVEIGSLLVAGLVAASGAGSAQKAALKYTFFSALSGSGLAIALALILGITGYANISDAISFLMMTDLGNMYNVLYISFAFLMLSWIYAGGLAPIHPLKSDVYRSAFPHATVLLQAQSKVMLVAIGLVLLRMFGGLPFAREAMLSISLLTMILGVVMALIQTDFRWILAYLIVSHSGLVTVGISLGTPLGIVGGLFQAVNDIVYMSVLLLCCEMLLYFNNGTSIRSSGGIAKKVPWLAAFAILGAFAASGIPPFNGFQSELILIQAALGGGLPEVAAVILMVSVSTFIALFRGIYSIFLKPSTNPLPEGSESASSPPRGMPIILGILVAITLILGVYPQLALDFLTESAVKVVYVPWVP
ncbi:MAG: proton-conducting transporter membrane subunit [Candidatus Verstraetearchaeota archaeon]|nr:proton-conducting transporter membrane subunit [Candidatus Verstraetearchaeota archaeon]